MRGFAQIEFGKNLTTGRFCRIDALCLSTVLPELPVKKLVFGENIQIGDRVHIAVAEKIIIGDHCLIASNVFISDHDHGSTDLDSMLIPPSARELITAPIQIGHSCWLGQNVCILKGVTLGEHCIVAAGAVVTRSFPAFSIIGGVPAKILKSPQKMRPS
ncbi:DapH/DapD/GlmU-related protein [Cyanobium sp. FACHB-13342]|uniref:DapH/DapD/GlmU-related protein n=1 Tax=Cyanobium sp. FACHB-13342 TaxID=2692793 RepID=UPI0018F01104